MEYINIIADAGDYLNLCWEARLTLYAITILHHNGYESGNERKVPHGLLLLADGTVAALQDSVDFQICEILDLITSVEGDEHFDVKYDFFESGDYDLYHAYGETDMKTRIVYHNELLANKSAGMHPVETNFRELCYGMNNVNRMAVVAALLLDK